MSEMESLELLVQELMEPQAEEDTMEEEVAMV